MDTEITSNLALMEDHLQRATILQESQRLNIRDKAHDLGAGGSLQLLHPSDE
jgi:hypothetical protein